MNLTVLNGKRTSDFREHEGHTNPDAFTVLQVGLTVVFTSLSASP